MDDVAELRRMIGAASPGPWSYPGIESVAGGNLYDRDRVIASIVWDPVPTHSRICRDIPDWEADANGRLIVAMRNALPTLLVHEEHHEVLVGDNIRLTAWVAELESQAALLEKLRQQHQAQTELVEGVLNPLADGVRAVVAELAANDCDCGGCGACDNEIHLLPRLRALLPTEDGD